MAAKQTKSQSKSGQTQGSRRSTVSQSTSHGSKSKNSQSYGKRPRMTKEEIAEQSAFHDEIVLVSALVVSILLILANFGMGGYVGGAVNRFLFGVFGVIAYLIPIAIFIGIAFHISNRGNSRATRKIITGSILLFDLMAFFQMVSGYSNLKFGEYYSYSVEHHFLSGGFLGGVICNLLRPLFGVPGTFVIIIAIFLICFMMFTGKTIVTSLSKRGEKSFYEMRERRRENASLRREYYQEKIEEESKEPSLPKESKRKAKTFVLSKKPYEVDDNTGEVKGEPLNTEITSNEDANRFGQDISIKEKEPKESRNTKADSTKRSTVDMEEIYPNMDDLSISGSYVNNQMDVPTYEDELREKFGDSTSLTEQVDSLEQNLMDQVTMMLEESEVKQNMFVTDSYDPRNVKAEPVGEARVTIEEIVEKEEVDISYDMSDPMDDVIREEYEPESNVVSEVAPMEHAEMKTAHKKELPGEEISTEDIANEINKVEEKPYVFPPLDLLAKPKRNVKGMTERDLKETAAKLQSTLESFGVRATITNVTCGPAVTRYEIQPEQGVKVSTITKLSDDIKLNLAATDIRIEAPIPGKAAVGIEVPNKENAAVMFRELIENEEFVKHPSDIAFAVGKDISGQSIITDIAKMPHLMIAGATGSGKSVCINTLIMSILYKADPKDVKLIMVDPKVVELSIYNGIPHLMIPVVTDPRKASAALNWAVVEMNERYKKFADLGVRDMKSYNAKIKQVEYLNDERYKKMPQIVIIVDELADLMMVAKGEVEEAICRLAQMARAAGLHLVIATQRPSVNVITGLIKANVPSRIAFAVSSAIDSRTIIDGSGAEKLLGKGDMLFLPQGYPKPVRLQGAFISDKEVGAVVDFLSKENGTATYNSDVTDHITSAGSSDPSAKSGNDLDEYFVQAGKFIIEKDKASIGMLQRVYKIGFNRAARIMDQLCEAGVVGPEEGTKPRKVIMSMDEFEQYVEEYV